MVIRQLVTKRWILVSILVIAAVGVMIRLGIWQLDRLEQRKAVNRQVSAVIDLPALQIAEHGTNELETQLYRNAIATGEYDFSHQVILTNQSNRDQLGVHLLTPMKLIDKDEYILVDRGWVPYQEYQNGDLDKYEQPGSSSAAGVLAGSSSRIGVRGCTNEAEQSNQQLVLLCVDLDEIQKTLPYELAALYLIRSPDNLDEPPPIGTTVEFDLSEGPHLGYAIQWFTFAIVLLIGYPIYVYRDTKARENKSDNPIPSGEVKTNETGENALV